MHRDDQRIVPGRHLDGAAGHELAGVVAGDDEFSGALQRDNPENEFS